MTKYVYMFAEGDASMRELLGGKGANLAEMVGLGLPVPNGFTVTTEACNRYYSDGQSIAPEITEEIFNSLKELEEATGKVFGDPERPLLLSVRSGSRASMPGMMDTVLNLGLNDEVAEGLTELTGNHRFVFDSYRRFILMFSDVVMGIPRSYFENFFDQVKKERGITNDLDLNDDDLERIVAKFKEIYQQEQGESFPQDVKQQLILATEAVFRSWNTDRAVYYRQMNNIPSHWGTAVNVQEMVYGNMGENSGTGVAFSRNPSTGENKLYGEYLMNAQGEDVVAGIRTPFTIDHLEEQMPEVYEQFYKIAHDLERHYGDMQDLEFTIENAKLFILQTRNGKRTAMAALQIAVDMVAEGLISREEALLGIDPQQLDALLHPAFDTNALAAAKHVAKGLPASPGAATGQIAFTAQQATEAKEMGRPVILVREETSPEDIQGMAAAEGILTSRGGMTSHAAVVARGMGKCCVSGCSEALISEKNKTLTIDGKVYGADDFISLDGSTGLVYEGSIPTVDAEMSGNFQTIMDWTDEISEMKVRANADTPHDSQVARDLGAKGIGLTRTEHMFFEADRVFLFRQMIVARTEEDRRIALTKIKPMQQEDFLGLFRVMDGLPVIIRLLDPPLHEFLPTAEPEVKALAEELGLTYERLQEIITELHELNPMLGHRGCRLAVSYPEIAEMQTEAIIGAALEAQKEGITVLPEIMVPLISEVKELEYLNGFIRSTADRLIKESGQDLNYWVGTMIEIPRACLTADEVAREADFFSFGTNDLTQMTYGLSRDDAGKILEKYYQVGIFEVDPTARLDRVGVGQLMRSAVELGRKTKPELELGICGEHGGEPSSIEFCQIIGLDYVSCSPYRVPIARLAAAQSALRYPRKK
ncbi:MAG: pyruvate, phosphate dikinase [Clostridiales bacterium]|jgi:pyruvate,orthophosphate dikinase|nr:pyruvate, phosphate dikinase [Clostridiales bacterium]MCK9349719.1 pyruvate, phosphate dikinase [Clostridiales bacterium]MDY0119671.1 pyruvate, phosphate dikinase [Clostridia bacterium]NLG29574.1 pyruvate, phosphate dikinase [Clostridiaceae bacterium]